MCMRIGKYAVSIFSFNLDHPLIYESFYENYIEHIIVFWLSRRSHSIFSKTPKPHSIPKRKLFLKNK